jgi:hypothetical protein
VANYREMRSLAALHAELAPATVDEFLDSFPGVSRKQVQWVLEHLHVASPPLSPWASPFSQSGMRILFGQGDPRVPLTLVAFVTMR